MNKYFNSAIIGNSKILACLNEKAELIRLYYPYIDYFQNIDIYSLGFARENKVYWFKDATLINQYYDGNIIHTKLSYNDTEILIRDYILINENLMIRKIKYNQPTSTLIYSKLKSTPDKLISGMCIDNSLIQYAQDLYMATFSNSKIIKAQINNVQDVLENANLRLEDYIGMSDSSAIMLEEKKEVTIYILLKSNLKETIKKIEYYRKQNEEDLYQEVKKYWREFLEKHLNYYIGEKKFSNKEIDIIERTIYLFSILSNKETGAVLAAPDVDEDFTKCGRYGYCWPRDALFINEAMSLLGMQDLVKKFYSVWAEKTQLKNGLFEQRYYSNGELAPSWGIQIDETASMVIGISKLENKKEYKKIVEKAVIGMFSFLDENFLSKNCFDLWEERKGSHLYSICAIYKALEEARDILKDFSEDNHLICEIDLLQPKILDAIINNFIENGIFKRSLDNNLPDISILSVLYPFEILDISDERITRTVEYIERELKLSNGGYLRYKDDNYMGGNAWIISSLWLSIYYIKKRDIEKAKELYNFVTNHSDSKGFLPEQIDRDSGKTAWITALSWSHAMYIIVGTIIKSKN